MRGLILFIVVTAALWPSSGSRAVSEEGTLPNLLRNPGLEGRAIGTLPPPWTSLVIGPRAQFAAESQERHGGRQSIRITAPEVTRAYLHSAPMAVAPGEQIRIGAWVKLRDVPPGQGTVIAIAEFAHADGTSPQVLKVGTATQKDWQQIEGTVTVPPLAANLRLRLGFSYSRGTTWWDDVTVRPLQPLVARIELPRARLTPAIGALPVTLLNRAARRDPVRLDLSLGTRASSTDVTLTGTSVQSVRLPLRITQRGRLRLKLALRGPGAAAPTFTEERTVTIPPPLRLLPPIPTHWVLEDGVPHLEGEAELAVTAPERDYGTLEVKLLDAAGHPRASWSGPTSRSDPEDFLSFSLRTPNLPEGAYRLVAELRNTKRRPAPTPPPAPHQPSTIDHQPLARAEHPWSVIPRRLARVTLNANGYLEQDGKAIFPLGIFNGGARMAEAAAAGFTVSHAYNAVRVLPGERPNDPRASDFLDQTGKAGMRALFLIPTPFAIAGDWQGFRRRIRMFRNHPALLAWDEEEGIARGEMKPELLAQIRRVLREEDPHHPLMVGDSRDVIGRVTDRSHFFPLPSMDLGMWWWYPIPFGARPGSALQGEERARGEELAPPTFLTLRDTGKPLWVGVQSYKKPRPDARYPNAVEYRAQAYVALIHGARGLMWYGGSVTGGLYLAPQEGHWEELKRLASELNHLAPVLMAPTGAPPEILPAGAAVSAALKLAPGRPVLLAANRGPNRIEVTLQSPAITPGPVLVLNEDRTVTPTAGALRDHFEPYAVHVYELSPR